MQKLPWHETGPCLILKDWHVLAILISILSIKCSIHRDCKRLFSLEAQSGLRGFKTTAKILPFLPTKYAFIRYKPYAHNLILNLTKDLQKRNTLKIDIQDHRGNQKIK